MDIAPGEEGNGGHGTAASNTGEAIDRRWKIRANISPWRIWDAGGRLEGLEIASTCRWVYTIQGTRTSSLFPPGLFGISRASAVQYNDSWYGLQIRLLSPVCKRLRLDMDKMECQIEGWWILQEKMGLLPCVWIKDYWRTGCT